VLSERVANSGSEATSEFVVLYSDESISMKSMVDLLELLTIKRKRSRHQSIMTEGEIRMKFAA